MEERVKLYEGKSKIVYAGPDKNTYVLYFKDDATAFNAQKKGSFEDKGILNNLISSILLNKISQWVPTHFIKRISPREQLVKKVEIVPVEVVFRNVAAGSFLKRLPFKEGDDLTANGQPLIEFFYKDDALGDPPIAEGHILHFGWMNPKELLEIKQFTQDIVKILKNTFNPHGIMVVDGKFEFGRDESGQLILSDDICPDGLRLWKRCDDGTHVSLDKDLFRKGIGGETEAYRQIADIVTEEVGSSLLNTH
jgi:phosphoribosylaminoimidazole-succinocarboxamide synthase